MKLIVGIGGASGAPYARRLLEVLRDRKDVDPSVVFSVNGRQCWEQEVGTDPRSLGFPVYGHRDFRAPFASGSAGYQAMGNSIDLLEMGSQDKDAILRELRSTMNQVRKATEIISHLRTFGRAAHVSREPVAIKEVILRSISLMQEQFRLRQIQLDLDLGEGDGPIVIGNAIRLEQVLINLLTNAVK